MTRSIQPTANNASTTSVATIPSTAGYAAGELIYYNANAGDFGTVPNTAATTAPFPINLQQGSMNGINGGTANSVGNIIGGSRTRQFSAVLSNGNIVQVWICSAGSFIYYPQFRVVDANNNVVVATTNISSTYTQTSYANISVCALSGGGFAVGWINTSGGSAGYPCYAVYSNAGAQVTAAFQDTAVGVTAQTNLSQIGMYAQPNGGFIGAYMDTSYNLYTRTYNATGTATAVSWLTIASSLSSSYAYGYDIAVRSDSTFVVVWASNSQTGAYNVVSAVNISLTGSQTFTSTIGNSSFCYGISACCLSNDTVIIGYHAFTSTSQYLPAFRPLPTGNVLGTEVALPTAGLSTASRFAYVTVRSFNNGANFIFLFADGSQVYKYCIYNSSLTLLTGSAPYSLYSAWAQQYTGISVLDFGGNLVVYFSISGYSTLNVIPNSYARIDKTSYQVVPFGTTTTMSVGTATAAVNGYARSFSTPNKAAFFAANTESVYGTGVVPSSISSTTTIESTAVQSVHCATYPDGRFAVAYVSNNSPYTAKVAVYSQSGNPLTTITLPLNGAGPNVNSCIKVTVLASNKLVVVLYANTGELYSYVYSSAYALLNTSPGLSPNTVTSYNYSFGLASLTNERFVLTYQGTSSYPYYTVYDSTATVIVGPVAVGGVTTYENMWCTSHQNGFYMGGFYTAGANYAYNVINTTGNTFVLQPGSPISASSGATMYGANPASMPNGTFMYTGGGGGTSGTVYGVNGSFQNSGYTLGVTTTANQNTTWMSACGWTPAGTGCVVTMDATYSTPIRLFSFTPYFWGTSNSASWPAGTVTSLSASIASCSSSTNAPQPTLAPLYGHTMLLSWKNSNNYPCFGFINAYPWNYSTTLTSGVTPSNSAVTVSPPAGYIFQGVSATAAPAGGAGQVVKNGPAQLNSNYSSSTALQGFDFQQPNGTAVDGVKGVILGRNVNLTGNN